jgi:ABC-type sugar transport system permease subunit
MEIGSNIATVLLVIVVAVAYVVVRISDNRSGRHKED